MRCDVVAVGTELLLGQIVDTNSAWIGEQLALNGIDSLLQVKVGDNLARMTAALRMMLDAADAVIVCGGLGPTHDDITRDALAAVMGVPLVSDPQLELVITEMFAARRRPMPASNLRQAQVPVGATVIPQTRGTAPGLICPVASPGGVKHVYAVPGVPHEMREMVERAVLPHLRGLCGEESAIVSRTLRTWGESESGLNDRLQPIIDELDAAGSPTLAFLASGWEGIKVRLTAKAPTAAEAAARLVPVEAAVRAVIGTQVFGVDDETMESVVLDLLRARGWTLAVAESVTGGLVAGRVTAAPGASEAFRGGVVAYASDAKFEVLGVTPGPVVSERAVIEMAEGVRRLMRADVGVALSGVAGPAEQEDQPVGTLHVAVVTPDAAVTRAVRLPGQRDQMRMMSVITALDLLRHQLLP